MSPAVGESVVPSIHLHPGKVLTVDRGTVKSSYLVKFYLLLLIAIHQYLIPPLVFGFSSGLDSSIRSCKSVPEEIQSDRRDVLEQCSFLQLSCWAELPWGRQEGMARDFEVKKAHKPAWTRAEAWSWPVTSWFVTKPFLSTMGKNWVVTVPPRTWCWDYVPSHSCNGKGEKVGEGREWRRPLPDTAQPDPSLLFLLCSTREKQHSRGMGMWFSYCIGLTANSDREIHSKDANIKYLSFYLSSVGPKSIGILKITTLFSA